MTAKLRMGMVGGGPGSLAGGLHLRAAALDGEIDLVAGAQKWQALPDWTA